MREVVSGFRCFTANALLFLAFGKGERDIISPGRRVAGSPGRRVAGSPGILCPRDGHGHVAMAESVETRVLPT